MSPVLVRLYQRLPPFCRTLAATARGWQLRSWRYGPETARLLEEALMREKWSAEAWRQWQQERLAYVLHRAATRVPFYRELWAGRRRKGDHSSWDVLENWPLLEKETVRRHATALVADDCDHRRMFHEHTSGTTGKAVQLWLSRQTVRAWYALFEARTRHWHGVTRHQRWAILGGQLVVAQENRRPPFWVWNAALHQLYMSSYHLAPDLIPHYLDALERYRVGYLLGYASSLNALAQQALRAGRRIPMRVAITNAEPLFDYQRHAIGEAFACPVQETYGMSEIVAAASECPHGALHLWPEAGWLETDKDGELIATGLFNADMPLIRYRVGDRVRFPESTTPCPCGRLLPAIAGVDGRVDDLLYTADGRQIGRLDPLFKADLPVVEAQIIQESLDCVRLLYVPAPQFEQADASDLARRIRDRMGPVEVIFEAVAQVPRERNGKFRAVVSRLKQNAAAPVAPGV